MSNTTTLLTDGNTNNDGSACGQLSAFSKQVSIKQKNGDLTLEDAAQLIDAAEAIEVSLGC